MTTTLEKKTKKSGRARSTEPAAGPIDVVPRVDLLPPSIELRRSQTAVRRLLLLGLAGLAVIAVTATVAASFTADAAERELAAAQARSAQLIAEQAQYSEVSTVKGQLADADSARLAALYAEADWDRLMREVDGALPAGMTLTSENITILPLSDSGPPSPSAVALDIPGVIEIQFTATAPALLDANPLLGGLEGLTGYVSATVDSVVGENEVVITGVVRLSAAALGGTPRTADLDPERVAELRDALEITVAPAPAEAPADSAESAAADDQAPTEE